MKVVARRESGTGAEVPGWKQTRDGSYLYVAPEIGKLQRVILRRPRLELRRLTPVSKNDE